jgi:hypothetical protein
MSNLGAAEKAGIRQLAQESSHQIAREGSIRAMEQVSPTGEGVFQQSHLPPF